MIKEFVEAWDKNNTLLLENFKKEAPSSYEDIVEKLVNIVINPYLKDNDKFKYPVDSGLRIENMTVIDDGDYQGTTIYIIPFDTYQPCTDEYVFTSNYYGSCSGCDTFQNIEMRMDYDDETDKYIVTDNIAEEFHTLALHLLQSFKYLDTEED